MTSLFGGVPAANSNLGSLLSQRITADPGQTTVTITNFTYTAGSGNLWVFLNGVKQNFNDDYTETDGNHVELRQACLGGEFIDVVGFIGVSLTSIISSAINLVQGITLEKYIVNHMASILDGPFFADPTGTSDSTAAFNRARDSGKPIYMPPGTYLLDNFQLNKDGACFIGYGSWSGQSSNTEFSGTVVLKYNGVSGANTAVVNASKALNGIKPIDPSTSTLANVTLTGVTIDGNDLADIPLIVVRGGNCNFSNITLTHGVRYAGAALLCFNGRFQNWLAYITKGAGVVVGEDIFTWGGSTACENMEFANPFGYFCGYDKNLVLQSKFSSAAPGAFEVEAGVIIHGARGLIVTNPQSANCSGPGVVLALELSTPTIIGGYSENCGQSALNVTGDFFDLVIVGQAGGVTNNLVIDRFNLNGANARVELAGVKPSRLSCGVLFLNMPRLPKINSAWKNYRTKDCDPTTVFTGVAPSWANGNLNGDLEMYSPGHCYVDTTGGAITASRKHGIISTVTYVSAGVVDVGFNEVMDTTGYTVVSAPGAPGNVSISARAVNGFRATFTNTAGAATDANNRFSLAIFGGIFL
jgi:hypothetical protein